MKLKEVETLSVQERFHYWISERESIREKKEAGKLKPWTEDEILNSYRFCNVRRMDDKVSQWILKNWYEPNYDHENMLLACTMARLFNQPDTLEYLGFPHIWQKSQVLRKLKAWKRQKKKIYNGAYIVSTNGLEGDKNEILVNRILVPVSATVLGKPHKAKLKTLCDRLESFWGISTFMAGQISSDLRWASEGAYRDRRIWAPVGPGSRRGMNRYQGREYKAPLNQTQFLKELAEVLPIVYDKYPKLEAIDVQNCFCEFDKYERALSGQGKPKQRYEGK